MPQKMKMSKPIYFPIGKLVATPGALKAMEHNSQGPELYVRRHRLNDWGVVPPEDAKSNDEALSPNDPQRLLSAYVLPDGTKIWVITEWDRSVTTILLPDEY